MLADLFRYQFKEEVSPDDVDSALLLAIWACESLHGEAQTRLDAAHLLDAAQRCCVIDARTPVGRDFNRLFVGFLSREIGADAFHIERVASHEHTEGTPS